MTQIHPKKVINMTKDELLDEFVDRTLDAMDTPELESYARNMMTIAMKTLADEELRAKIAEFYPDLLEEV